MSSRVSVVIPVHDRIAPLRRALASVVAQTRPPLEVIVVDDGSSIDVAGMVQREFPDVVLLRERSNRGVSHARNRGIGQARGDWVALLDSDDEWLEDKLALQGAVMSTSAAPLVHGDETWIRNGVRVNPRRRHRKRGGDIFLDCLPLCVISPSAAVIRREVLAELGGFDESLPACEDYDLWLRLCVRWPVAYVDRPLLTKYGGHPDQLSRRHWGMDRFRVQALEKLLADPALTGSLHGARRQAVVDALCRRLAILADGAEKRGRLDEAAARRQRLAAWRGAPTGAVA